jgi:hypothetical protein
MADNQQQSTQFVIGLVNNVSPQLKEMTKDLRDLQRQARQTDAVTVVENAARSTTRLGLAASAARHEFVQLGNFALAVAKGFGGGAAGALAGAGAAGAILGAAEQLRKFSQNRIQLQMFATDVGFSTQYISFMERVMGRMGVSTEQGREAIAKIGSKLREMDALGPGSTLYRGLADIGEGKFAAELLTVVREGKFDQAHKLIIEKFGSLNAAKRFIISNHLLEVDESILVHWTEFTEGVQPAYEGNLAELKEYEANMALIHDNIADMWAKVSEFAIIQIINPYFRQLKRSEPGSVQHNPKVFLQRRIIELLGEQFRKYMGGGGQTGPRSETEEDRNRLYADMRNSLQKIDEKLVQQQTGLPAFQFGGTSEGGLALVHEGEFVSGLGTVDRTGIARLARGDRVYPGGGGGPLGGSPQTVRGSWFGNAFGWVDKGDLDKAGRPLMMASGVSPAAAAIALPFKKYGEPVGRPYLITDVESGRQAILPHLDKGPGGVASADLRGIDFTPAAAMQLGYATQREAESITDKMFRVEPAPGPVGRDMAFGGPPDSARKNIDLSNAMETPTPEINIRFHNVPRDVKTNGSSSGGNLTLSRSSQSLLSSTPLANQ